MNVRLLFILGVILLFVSTPAQSQKTSSAANLIKDVTTLLTRHYPNRTVLNQDADRIAQIYADKLKQLKREVARLTDEAKGRATDMGLQQKLNLALELWRVRASIDLLSLTDPSVLKELTGLDLPDFRNMRRRFNKAQGALSGSLPGF